MCMLWMDEWNIYYIYMIRFSKEAEERKVVVHVETKDKVRVLKRNFKRGSFFNIFKENVKKKWVFLVLFGGKFGGLVRVSFSSFFITREKWNMHGQWTCKTRLFWEMFDYTNPIHGQCLPSTSTLECISKIFILTR